ncbi:hypothetical protein EV191_11274 [Tamaricihabitans halophyticus]|uniref:Uncharacterized protein n=1 Tax=Tamaricihabitans halophyticus TaxID=1262583 RepID=A0A4R2QF36_9PSEU|nr:hypothetical protein EV191_11274 [Tamaricihabitans halophyticus]
MLVNSAARMPSERRISCSTLNVSDCLLETDRADASVEETTLLGARCSQALPACVLAVLQ